MSKVEVTCPNCSGVGNVAHVPRVLQEGEIPNPVGLDKVKPIDTCEVCGGSGKKMVEFDKTEFPTPAVP
jgi:uncharacterized Zn finger protein